MKNWILAARLKTLPAAIVPVWVGSVPVLSGHSGHEFSWLIFAATLLSCLCIQIATNLFNDAIDSEKGADTAERLGPKRVTASGLIPRKTVMTAALVVCAIAAVFAIPLIIRHGWIPIAIGAVSFLLAFGYTGGPVPLAYKGLGELFVIIFFGLIAVFGTYFMQTGEIFPSPGLIIALQVGFYSTVLIAINNLRDIPEDRQSGKMTLAARFGKNFARTEVAFFSFAPIFMWFMLGPTGPRTVAALASSFVLASIITLQVFVKEPGSHLNKTLAIGALQLLNFALWYSLWLYQ